MASAVVGVKRSFATMSDQSTPTSPVMQGAGQEALVSHLRDIVSVDSSGPFFQKNIDMPVLIHCRFKAIQYPVYTS